MYGEHREPDKKTWYWAVMENDGEFAIYKSEMEFGKPQIILDRWVVPEGVALALVDLFEREEESRLVAAATDEPAEWVNRPIDDYQAEINSDEYIAYLNNNN